MPIYITLIEWTDVWYVPSGGYCDRVAEWGIYPPIPPRWPVVPPMATVSPIGSNRLSFSREKVLKLTYSKVETQTCGGNAPDPHFSGERRGREGREEG